jgi:hypothetical protein
VSRIISTSVLMSETRWSFDRRVSFSGVML